MIDGHMHLEYGPLSKAYVLEFVEEAKKQGLTCIQILDHTHRFIEFKPIYEELRAFDVQNTWLLNERKFCNSIHEFIALMKEIQAMDLGITVLFGLEVCYSPTNEAFLRHELSKYQFDFLVGAIHSIDGKLYDMGFSKQLLWDQVEVDTIYQRYYDLVASLIKSNLFTQLAHPDQLKLFNNYPSFCLKTTYEELATLLIKHNVKAENNTGIHYRYHHQDIGINDEMLRVFKAYKVPMITASDAHYPQHVGRDIALIYDKTYGKMEV